MFEAFYKFIVVLVLAAILVLLACTGYIFYEGDEYPLELIKYHQYAGIIFCIFVIIHLIIKINKIPKLTKGFINIFLKNKLKIKSNKDDLFNLLSERTVAETCSLFSVTEEEMAKILALKKIYNFSKDEKLINVVDLNASKVYFILEKIIKIKFNIK